MIKRTACLFMAIIIFSCGCLAGNAAQDKSDIATVVLGIKPVLDKFEKVQMGDVNEPYPVKRNGREGWICDLSLGTAARYIYFDLNSSFLDKIEDGTGVEIEVTYFDCDSGYFTLTYDGQMSAQTNAEIVYLGISNEWKTHKFIIDDPYFGNRLNNADFRIGIHSVPMRTSPASVVFAQVTVNRIVKKNPVEISLATAEVGNIFCNTDEKKFTAVYKNLADHPVDALVLYEAVKKNGDVVWQGEDTLLCPKGQEVAREIIMDIGEYQLFDFRVTLKSEGIHSVKTAPFSVVNSTDGGSVNKRFIFNTHMYRNETRVEPESELVIKSGAAGIRGSFEWGHLELSKGNFRSTPAFEKMLDSIKENKFEPTVILCYGNTNYMSGDKEIPITDQQLQAWEGYCTYMVNRYKALGVPVRFTIWNEPNHANFNRNNATPAEYAKLCEVSYKLIKSLWPEAKVGIGSLTGIQGKADKWFIEMMDAGAWRYTDAIALHPYKIGVSMKDAKMDETVLNHYVGEFKKYGRDDIEVWYTEIGYSTSDDHTENAEINRLRHIITSYIALTSAGVCDTFEYYDLVRDGVVRTNREDNFGVVNNGWFQINNTVSHSATESYLAITNLNTLLADTQPAEVLKLEENTDVYRYKNIRDGSDVAVLWSDKGDSVWTLNLGTDRVTVYDAFGNRKIISGKDGVFTFYFNEVPMYIAGNFTAFENSQAVPLTVFSKTVVDVISGDIVKINVQKNFDEPAELKVRLSGILELIDVAEFKDNKADITLKMLNTYGHTDDIIIDTVRGEKVLQSTLIQAVYKETASLEFSTALADKNDVTQWVFYMNVTNNSATNSLNGYVTFLNPKIWRRLTIPVGRIPSGMQAGVKVALPKMKQLGMYNVECVLNLEDGRTVRTSKMVDFTVAVYAREKPVIDGIISDSEWNKDSGMLSANPEQVKAIKNYGGIEDLSAVTYVMWDEDYFYMASRVTDDIFSNPEIKDRIWAGDSIQVGIFYGEEGHIALGQSGTAYTEIGIAKTQRGVEMWRWRSQDGSLENGEVKGFEGAVIREGTHTFYEFKVPWSEILPKGQTVSANNSLGFSMLVNDNDGNGRRGWIEYASGIGLSKNTALFTYITLLE